MRTEECVHFSKRNVKYYPRQAQVDSNTPQSDDFAQRRLRFEFHEASQFFHERSGFRPAGTTDNSPEFQLRVKVVSNKSSPGVAADKTVAGNLVRPPAGLVDFIILQPAVETAGYLSSVAHATAACAIRFVSLWAFATEILFRRQPDDFAERRLRFELHEAFRFFHQRFAAG